MSWISVKEYARIMHVSERAIRKSIASGKYQTRTVPHPSRRDQVSYEVFMDEKAWNEYLDSQGIDQKSAELRNCGTAEPECGTAEPENRIDEPIDEPVREPVLTNQNGELFGEPVAKESLSPGDQFREQGMVPVSTIRDDRKVQSSEAEPKALSSVVLTDKAEFESYPRVSRDIAYARLEIVKTWIDEKQKAKLDGVKVGDLETSFIRQLKIGKLCAPAIDTLTRNGEVRLSIRTVYRWEKAWKDNDSTYPIALVDKYVRTRSKKDQQYARSWIKMQAVDPRGHSIVDIVRLAETAVPGFDMSYRTVARIVEKARQDKFVGAALTGPTAWKNKARPHIRRVNDCIPGDKWEADGKTMNVFVMSPFWFHNDKSVRDLIRPVIVCWLDVSTWMITGWATWLSESWHLARTAFVDGMQKCGVPKSITYDGGGSFFNIYTNPEIFAGRKSQTAAVKEAKRLLASGYRGFYEQFGVEKKIKTIPGNSESKQIEPAWGAIFGDWEKRQFAYVGKDISSRPEWMRMTSKKLIKTYKDKIMTWDEYTRSIGEYINEWNNRPRPGLTRLDGSPASPIEAYMEFEHHKPTKEIIEHACWHPRQTVVQRDGVYLDGLLYRHPAFGVYLGQSVLVEYDERNRFEADIATLSGEKLAQPARLVIPGMHMDDEQSKLAMMDRARYERELKQVYLERVNNGESVTMQEMNSITARVELMLQDQSRRQEKEKDMGLPSPERKTHKNLPAPEIEAEFESLEDEFAQCTLKPTPEAEQTEEDAIIDDVLNDLHKIGLRSTR